MLDKNFFDQIQKILSRLTAVVTVLDDKGRPILPDSAADSLPIPSGLEMGRPQVIENRTWLPTQIPPIAYIVVHGIEAASVDCALLAHALIQSLITASPVMDRNDACRRVLRDEIVSPELEAVAHEHQIALDLERTAMLFHITQTNRVSAMEMLNEMIPTTEDDLLIEMDRHTLVLLKSMAQVENMDELTQLAEAIEQTLASETANQVTIGIGESKASFAQISESYREARRAMEVGRVFRAEENVYLYRRLVLERFLTEIPKEMGSRYHHLMFNRKTARLFNEEMLHTIEMFFAKDLNLSDTARQLYIHRNTLVYRLDKVQRQTGLDLRNFEDAITFKMLLLLGKCGMDKPTQIH